MKLVDFRDIEKLPVDWEDIVEMLVARIKEKLPNKWSDFLASNYGMVIIEAVAYECMLLYFNANAVINEAFLATAKTSTAVYRFAKSIGYKPKGPSQASATVRFYIPSEHNRNIYIPKYTRLSASGSSSYFYTTEAATIDVGSTYVDVEVKSGTVESETFISTGIARYAYKLAVNPVNTVESVVVNTLAGGGTEYTYVDFIDINDPDGTYYTIDYNEDYYASISFGDGTYGANPGKGVTFDVMYIANGGSADNVGPYEIDTVLDTIYDSANTIVSVSVTNAESAVGGGDAESITEIKENIPAIYRTQERLVTLQDFYDLVGAYSGVKKVGVIDHTKMDDIGIFGVKVAVIPDGSRYMNEAFRDELYEWIDSKKIIATQVDVIDPTYISFDVTVNVKLDSYSNSSIAINKIRSAIHDYLYWENREFGQSVDKSELYSLIKAIDGVNSIADITLEENSKIYVDKDPTVGSDTIYIVDIPDILSTGASITIMNREGTLALKAKVSEYDRTNGIIKLVDSSTSVPVSISEDMGIAAGCAIYPTLLVDGNYDYGTKEISIKDYTIVNTYDESGNYVTSKKEYHLLNLPYTTIYFGNVSNDVYRIMYVSGSSIYLDRPLELDLTDNTEITVMTKKYVPALASSTTSNATQLELTTYPRFGVGATLMREDSVAYTTAVTSMVRSVLDVDYMSSSINTNQLVKIEQIYINSSEVFEAGLDYNLRENDRVIEWTAVGQSKITLNSQYYVQYVKKSFDTSDTNLTHYVTSINGKVVEVSPPIPVQLQNGTAFEYESDIYNLMPYEIADQGTVIINVL